jgi:hypothetical protein
VTDSDNQGWKKSSFSDTTNCLEVRVLSDGSIAVRNSNHTDGGQLVFTRDEMSAWLSGCKAGEFDDLL